MEGRPRVAPQPTRNQDLRGVPVGRKKFVEHELDSRAICHAELLEKIPSVNDLQCAWFILLYCGVSRANFFIRVVRLLSTSRRETRGAKSGVASPLWSQRQYQNPPGPSPRCPCLQEVWGAATVSDRGTQRTGPVGRTPAR